MMKIAFVATAVVLLGLPLIAPAQQQRALGLDISAWQGSIAQTTWNNIHNVENRQFVILRSSRGGTTGYYNQNDAANNNGQNTFSQRYDDPYYIQNINRATAAGMYAGSYHFSRPDIIESTLNSGGIRNDGADEADHFIQMAGPWMRPGYLVPVHDLEAGINQRSSSELAQFAVDFSNRIYEQMGIRPGVYIGGNYADHVQGASSSLKNQIAQPFNPPPSMVSPTYPVLWSARWPNQTNPDLIDVQNGHPKDSVSYIYGPWDDYGVTHPWSFWQYTSRGRLQSFNNGTSNLDMNVTQGGVEFLKDCLVPAVWMNNSSGNWGTLSNWNSGQTPIAPVQGSGQVARVGTLTMPVPRLPGAAGSGVTSGQNDTVILERPNANITVTLSSGTHNIRKLYMREALNITGGSLNINYVPSWDSTPISAQFSGPVTLIGNAHLAVHTLQVDQARTFTLNGGTMTFDRINLMPHSSSPAKMIASGNLNLNPPANGTATIATGNGPGYLGTIDLAGGNRTFNVGNGTSEVDLSVDALIFNGALTKAGLGTMRVTATNVYHGGTIISAGTLLVNNASSSGTGSGVVTVNGGTLGGTGTITGPVTINSNGTIMAGTASTVGVLTLKRTSSPLETTPKLNGTTLLKINRNGGSPLADKIVRSGGKLQYSGTLVVTNIGAELLGGEVFSIFSADSYSGAFSSTQLPALNSGLNWYLGNLATNGTIKVNRRPVANSITFTNNPTQVLEIPISSLTSNVTDADGNPISLTSFDSETTNGIPLVSSNGFILYTNDLSVTDEFAITLEDGHGGSATDKVRIVPSVAGRFASPPSRGDSTVTLHFAGLPGWTYYLERSTILPIWLTISTNIAPANGLFDYIDDFNDLSEPPATVFYRLRWAE